MIPKRLIQTHRSKAALNLLHRKCQQTLRLLHPDFDYRFFSDRDCLRFIKERWPGFLPLWHFYPRPVQRADFFRILVVYDLGGFYFDLDVYFHEPIHELTEVSLVFPAEWEMSADFFKIRHRTQAESSSHLQQLGNYGFGAVRRHWFLREILEEMVRRTGEVDMQNLSNDDVLYSTGPDLVNAVARVHESQLRGELLVLPGESHPREPKPPKSWGKEEWFQFGRFGNHLMTSVWRS